MLQTYLEKRPWLTVLVLALGTWAAMSVVSELAWAGTETAALEGSLKTFYCGAVGLMKGIGGKVVGLAAIAAGAGLWFTGSKGAAVPVFGVAGLLLLGPTALDALFSTAPACP